MGRFAKRRNEGLGSMLAHTEAPLSGQVEVEMTGSKMEGENV